MNKIVLAQINTIAGDIDFNLEKIIENINKAKEEKADLIIFPELSLVGYPFGDILIRHKAIIEKQLHALEKIASISSNITVLVGFAEPTEDSNKKPFYNSVAVIQNEQIINIARKRLLPNYSEHNEYKFFEPANETPEIFEINGEKFGIIICEDILNDKNHIFEEFPFCVDPIEEIMKKNPSTIINCACSISRNGKEYERNELFSSIAKKYKVNYIYVNQALYADNLCFDGLSRIYDTKGKLTLRAKFLEEDFAVSENYKGVINKLPKGMDKKADTTKFDLNYQNDLERTYKSIIFAIKEYFKKNGFKKAVLGLSGGLDSCVCATLLVDALGKGNVYGISMPSKITSIESKNDARILASNLGINFFEVALKDEIESMKHLLNTCYCQIKAEKYENPTTIENLQARLRATILWSISNEHKQMLPIATSDKSEAYIGYATINGDMSGGFAPIIDVTKTKLFALADYMNKNRIEKNAIPKSVLKKPPGAELKINPKTGKTVCAEEENMPYEFLDEIIWFVENQGFGINDLLKHKFYYEKKSYNYS